MNFKGLDLIFGRFIYECVLSCYAVVVFSYCVNVLVCYVFVGLDLSCECCCAFLTSIVSSQSNQQALFSLQILCFFGVSTKGRFALVSLTKSIAITFKVLLFGI